MSSQSVFGNTQPLSDVDAALNIGQLSQLATYYQSLTTIQLDVLSTTLVQSVVSLFDGKPPATIVLLADASHLLLPALTQSFRQIGKRVVRYVDGIDCSGSSDCSVNDMPMAIDDCFVIDLLCNPIAPEVSISGHVIATVNTWIARGTPVLSIHLPYGLNADSGAISALGAIKACWTMSFQHLLLGALTHDGPDYGGQHLWISVESMGAECSLSGTLLRPCLFPQVLQARKCNSHKGVFGSVAVVGGGEGMVGAPILAARSALKMGAGCVYVSILSQTGPVYDAMFPELMLVSSRVLFESLLFEKMTVWVVGPGMSDLLFQSSPVIRKALESRQALVLDATALTLIANDKVMQGYVQTRDAPTILTPHPLEAARLLGCSIVDVQADRVKAACALAKRFVATVVLKGCGSIVAHHDGRWWVNTTGHPNLATAGSGDVLAGMIGALIASHGDVVTATLAAVYIHGLSGEHLAEEGMSVGATASDIAHMARCQYNNLCLRH